MALVAAHEISKTIRRGIKRAAEFGGRVYNDIDGTSGGHFLLNHKMDGAKIGVLGTGVGVTGANMANRPSAPIASEGLTHNNIGMQSALQVGQAPTI